MAEAFKCPSCAAPLEYPSGGGLSIRCPFCNTTVMLDAGRAQGTPNEIADRIGPAMGKAIEFAKIAGLVRAGQKIEAIKIYRQATGASLAAAKTAIDNLALTGSGPKLAGIPDPVKLANAGLKFGCGLTIAIAVFAGLIVMFVARSVHNQMAAQTPFKMPPIAIPTITLPATPPPAPTFAHMAMEFGTEGIGAGQFKDSRSIAIDGAGHIYVGEYSDGRVQVFDPDGKFLTEWSVGHGKSLLDLAVNRQGTIYAVLPAHIMRYAGATGTPLGEMDTTTDDSEEFYMDACVALDGNIYAIAANSDIVILTPDGKIKSTIKTAEKVGEDVSFFRIAVAGTGEIFALDRQKGVFKFAPDGRYINRFGGGDEPGAPRIPGHLFSPNNLTIDGQGRLFVSDDGPAVQVFDLNGRFIDDFGDDDVVFGVAVNDHDEIFACYRNQHSVRKFVLDKH